MLRFGIDIAETHVSQASSSRNAVLKRIRSDELKTCDYNIYKGPPESCSFCYDLAATLNEQRIERRRKEIKVQAREI